MRLKTKQIPGVKQAMLINQNHRCKLCRIDLSTKEPKDVCLDHDHKTGKIRSVLCRNCNGIEGKVFNLANRAKRDGTPAWWLKRLLQYYSDHENGPEVYHPTHKTEEEKRLERNKKARLARAKKQATKNIKRK